MESEEEKNIYEEEEAADVVMKDASEPDAVSEMENTESPLKKRRLADTSKGQQVKDATLVCVDTITDLKHKLVVNKEERLRRREERKIAGAVQQIDIKSRKDMLEKLNTLNKEEEKAGIAPPLVPGNAAGKMAFGRKITHARNLSDEEVLRADLERITHVDEIEEEKLGEYDAVYRSSLGLKNIASHFMSSKNFVEHRPTRTIKVAISGKAPGKKTLAAGAQTNNNSTAVVIIQGDTAKVNREKTAEEQDGATYGWTPEMTTTMAPMLRAIKRKQSENDSRGGDANDIEEADQGEEQTADAQADMTIEHPQMAPLTEAKEKTATSSSSSSSSTASKGKNGKKQAVKFTRAQLAVTEQRGQRRITEDEASLLSAAGEVRAIKAKPVRYEYLKFTETPLSGNMNVRAARLDFMDNTALDKEGMRSTDPSQASRPSHHYGAMSEHINEKEASTFSAASAITAGMEMRHTAVVDEEFFESSLRDEAQQHLLRKGDKLALDMASARHRPSRLPALPIEDFAMREREQGREPTSLALENARLQALLPDNLKGTKLPLVIVEPDTPHQPMYRYFEMFGKTRRLATEDMIEELIFDKKRVIATAAGKELIYALDLPDDAGTPIPTRDGTSAVKFVDAHGVAAQINPDTGMKILHKHMAQRARNIKRQRDVIGRQAEADPPRLRSRIADARVAYFLERWNLRDRLLAHDHPDLFYNGDSGDELVPAVVDDEDAMDIDGEDTKAKRAELAAAKKKMKKQRDEEKREFLERLENAAMHGPLGMILARHRQEIKDRGTKTGANYFTSSEELGSARLHPSANPDMERIRMKYILASLEQPRRNERFCPNARECIGYRGNLMRIDNSTYFSPTNSLGVILKEFLTPRQRAHYDLTGELPRKRQLCYLCGTDETTRTVYACQRTGIQPTKPIHTFCVFTNEEGEYANEQCLPVSWRMAAGRQILTGIVDSYPAFNENDYLHDVRHENGVVVRFMRYRPPRSGF